MLRTSKLSTRQNDLEDLSAVYNAHRELFFEDEKDKKDDALHFSEDALTRSESASGKEALYAAYEPEIQPRGAIETREYLREVGIKDEMQKIELYRRAEAEDGTRAFERLNVENPINKVD